MQKTFALFVVKLLASNHFVMLRDLYSKIAKWKAAIFPSKEAKSKLLSEDILTASRIQSLVPLLPTLLVKLLWKKKS